MEPIPEQAPASPEMGIASSMLNGTNGLGTNGLGTNGLGTNGLGTNGLGTSGMDGASFTEWFNKDPVLADSIMKYVVRCAVGAGGTRSWTNPKTNVAYHWSGSLGLTPGWASGQPATELEQQVLTACLAAHTNRFGVSAPFSILGLDATGQPIPMVDNEKSTYSKKEACFFGNLFSGEGVFAGRTGSWNSRSSSVRACGLEGTKPNGEARCPPLIHMGICTDFCVSGPNYDYYLSCTYNGKVYRALTTRIRLEEIYTCGDGVCQLSESCGTGSSPDNCRDCGPCG